MTITPKETRQRVEIAMRLFLATWKKINETRMGKFPAAQEWITTNRPELAAEIDATQAKADEEAGKWVDGVSEDDKAFRAAGSVWFAAWKKAAAALPETPPRANPEVASAPPAP